MWMKGSLSVIFSPGYKIVEGVVGAGGATFRQVDSKLCSGIHLLCNKLYLISLNLSFLRDKALGLPRVAGGFTETPQRSPCHLEGALEMLVPPNYA